MDNFIFEYPVKQYFGKGCAEEAIKTELKRPVKMYCWRMAAVR